MVWSQCQKIRFDLRLQSLQVKECFIRVVLYWMEWLLEPPSCAAVYTACIRRLQRTASTRFSRPPVLLIVFPPSLGIAPQRHSAPLLTSDGWPDATIGSGLFSTDAAKNPLYSAFNRGFVPYRTQDLFLLDTESPGGEL